MAERPRDISDAPDVQLPRTVNALAQDHPDLWAAYQKLGEAAGRAGSLNERERRLVHLAYALASGSEGAAHSHVRRAQSEGISADELEHVALLAVTTLGWPQAVRALTAIRDVTGEEKHRNTPKYQADK